MGNSFSRLKKYFKHRVRGRKHEPGRTGANTAEERVDSSDLPPRPGPRVAASGHDGEQNRTSTDVQRDRPRDQSPQPESMPASGGDDTRQRQEADVDKKEVSQNHHSRLNPEVEVMANSGASQEVERVHPSPSTGEPNST